MKKKFLIFSVITIIVILIALFMLHNITRFNKSNTYIYDKDGNEIAVIKYGGNVFSNVKTEHLEATINSILEDVIVKESVTRDEAKNILSTGGYKIYTTQNTEVLNLIEEIYTNDSNFDIEDIQSATVIIDNKNGQVAALIGGRNYTPETKNRAINYIRQPSTALTALSVYAYGLDKGTINLDSVYIDEETSFGAYKPKNYYGNYLGEITVKEAFKVSSNIIAIKIAQEIGIDNIYQFLKSIGFKSLSDYDKNLAAMSLGGLTNGVTTLEMAVGYETVANGGDYRDPIYYTKILDRKEKVYLESNQEKKEIISNDTSNTMKELMRVDGKIKEVYLKSAETNDNRDNWSIGFTDKYTIATWCGYDEFKSIKSNKNESKKVWEIIVNRICEGK